MKKCERLGFVSVFIRVNPWLNISSVKQKRRAVEQRPREILRDGETVGVGFELDSFEFPLGRWTAQAGEVDVLDELPVVLFGLHEFRDAAVGRRDGLRNSRAVDEAERVAQRQTAGAFTFAGGLALGPAEELEEIVASHHAVGNLGGPHPAGNTS